MNNMNHPMMTFMTPDDLEKGTGYKAQAKQCKVLTEHGIFFVKDANGAPHVTWYSFNNPTHLRFSEALAHNDEPDFSAMG